ncbi:MAG TPA: DUF1192 family protein [Sphingopyxis sp.]|nr:DUF1192 family protein [Sphingopyxis sp.]
MDEDQPRHRDNLLQLLIQQPLDPYSVEELADRMALLTSEIERTALQMQQAQQVRSLADDLFRKN